ncbi:MAG: hypothetical protein ACSLFQ_19775 [Thermoanaerobaculia bacterium]
MTSSICTLIPEDRFKPRRNQVREYTAGGRTKGAVLRAHLRWAREHASMDDFKAMLDAMPAARVAELSSTIYATSWYPLQTLIDLDRAIVATIGSGERFVMRSVGRFSAATNLGQLHRSLVREDPHPFLRHVALLQGQFTDFGASTWESLGGAFGRVTHRHWRCFSPLLCEASIGFYEECVRMAGGTSVSVEETACVCRDDKHCVFEVRWRA